MKSFAFITRLDPISKQIEDKIRSAFLKEGLEESLVPEVVIVIGGDGTFVFAVQEYLQRLNEVSFFGIHTGTLGFYTDYKEEEIDLFIHDFMEGQLEEIFYPLLEAETKYGTYYGINEVRIENMLRTQEMIISIDGDEFETFRGTGICVSTQLGSTGYNRSLKGAVIAEGIPAIQLAEVAGIHHAQYRSLNSPLILKDTVTLTIQADNFQNASLGYDQQLVPLDEVHEVMIRVSQEKKVKMLRGKNVSYYDRLKSLF